MGRQRINAARRGVTLSEIVSIATILLVVGAVLFPVFAKSRAHSDRRSGSSNQKQIGIGLLSYIQDYDERFPPAASWVVVNGKTYRSNWAVDVQIPGAYGPGTYGAVIPGITQSYIKNNEIFRDPQAPRDARLTYMYNDLIATTRQSDISDAARTVMTMDGANVLVNVGHAYEPNGTPEDAVVNARGFCNADQGTFVNGGIVTQRSGGAYYSFVDGHVKWYRPEAIYFPPRSSASRRHKDLRTGARFGPNPGHIPADRKPGSQSSGHAEEMTFGGKAYKGTFHLQ